MAGDTATIAWFNSSMGFPSTSISGSGYPLGQIVSFEDIVGPTESNQSDTYIGNIMSDPRDILPLDDFLDAGFFIEMPCRRRTKIKVKINSITRGYPTPPDFED